MEIVGREGEIDDVEQKYRKGMHRWQEGKDPKYINIHLKQLYYIGRY